MPRPATISALAVISYWIMLVGYIDQIRITWLSGDATLDPVFMVLLTLTSFCFIGAGLSSRPRDRSLVISRAPAVIIGSVAVYQSWVPALSAAEMGILSVLNLVAVCGLGILGYSKNALPVLLRASRAVFALAFSVGLLLQLAKLFAEGAAGVSPLLWGSFVVSSGLWMWHFINKGDRLFASLFSAGAACGIVVLVLYSTAR